jgi:hypothetical protein
MLLFLMAICCVGCSNASSGSTEANMVDAMKLRKELSRGSTPAADTGAQEQATGWSTLRGQFTLDGTPPPPVQLDVKSDLGVCAPGNKPVFEQQVVVDEATKGIANIVIFARKVASEHVHPDMAPGKTDEVVFDQKDCLFVSPVLVMQTSQKVKVKNSDAVAHNTNIEGTGFNNLVAANREVDFVAPQEASSPIKTTCNIHPWMVAYILPRNNSYFAVTKGDGTFEIPNLPAGITLEFQVWQQKSGNLQQVAVDGNATTWKSGRFTTKLTAEQPTELKVTVPAVAFQ